MRKTAMLCAVLSALMLFGCAKQEAPAPDATDAPATSVPAENPAPSPDPAAPATAQPAKTIQPLPAPIQADALVDCEFPASFDAADVHLDDDGMLVVELTAYYNELFDFDDVAALTVGDTVLIEGQSVVVDTLERPQDGWVLINGGHEGEGFTLTSDDNAVFYAIDYNDSKHYREIGDAILPVDQEFILLDSSDPNSLTKLSYAGDFLIDMETSDRSFLPYDTTVTVKDGFITNITVIFVP